MDGSESELPDVGTVIAPILARVAEEQRPLLIALAERLAAERYRSWAEHPDQRAHRRDLLGCAEREEEIAGRVEALFADAPIVQKRLLEENPELAVVNRELFEGRVLADQFTIQARGERLGAATWRSLARRSDRAEARDAFLRCAELEEASARVLEEIVAANA